MIKIGPRRFLCFAGNVFETCFGKIFENFLCPATHFFETQKFLHIAKKSLSPTRPKFFLKIFSKTVLKLFLEKSIFTHVQQKITEEKLLQSAGVEKVFDLWNYFIHSRSNLFDADPSILKCCEYFLHYCPKSTHTKVLTSPQQSAPVCTGPRQSDPP